MYVYMCTHMWPCVCKSHASAFLGQWFSCYQGSVEMNTFVQIIMQVVVIFVEVQYMIIVPLSDMNSVEALPL